MFKRLIRLLTPSTQLAVDTRATGISPFPANATLAEQWLPYSVGLFVGAGRSDSGVAVNEITAFTASTVRACIAVIAEALSTLPLSIQNKRDGTKLPDHQLLTLFNEEPNPFITAAVMM